MQHIILFLLLWLLPFMVPAQAKPLPADPTKMTMEDMKRLANMSPVEQEAYRKQMLKAAEEKAKKLAVAANVKLDETVLPTTPVTAPVKDIKRLAALPVQPPSRQQLLAQTAEMEAALKTVVVPQTVQQVETFSAGKSVKEIQSAAIGGWYRNNPEGALLLGMKAVQKAPGDITGWNNLAALFNMAGLEHQAVPVLMHCLQEKPDNSMLLNNMGQAYLGMGDLSKATQYLTRCLSIDELHPEANHSMALLRMFNEDFEKAAKYFEKEMQVAQRRSSLAQLVKSGKRSRINLAALRKQKMQRDGTDNRNFFSEIAPGKFDLPAPPMRAAESKQWKAEHAGYLKSLHAEFIYWSNMATVSAEQLRAEGKRYPGIYMDLVNELIRDLGDKYIPLLGYISEDDVTYLTRLEYDYAKKDHATVCPSPPHDPENFAVLQKAYEKKCCDLKTPLADQHMQKYNSFVWANIQEAQAAYKEYINGMISNVQLDPSESNNRLVYSTVANYFGFLIGAMGAYKVLDLPASCHDDMTIEEAEEIIMSNRDFKLKCPDWLQINISLKYAKLKADCNTYNIEADIYGLINAGAEKSFKTGTSTLYVGAGIEGQWKGIAKGEIKQQFYIVFDSNNQFADLGMRGSGSGELAGGMIGAGLGYDFALNSGFNAQAEVKSTWISNYEKALTFIAK